MLTADEFRADALTESARSSFFRSGVEHVEHVLATYARLRGDAARFHSALDFGCGVGRLVLTLSERFDQVTGVDISSSMLAEATSNGEREGRANIRLLRTPEFLADRGATGYDLVHTILVF